MKCEQHCVAENRIPKAGARVTAAQGERSFHIFYQVMRGASDDERAAWRLPPRLADFRYLSGTGAVHAIDGIDDAADFRTVRAAMTAVRINRDLQLSIFAIISAVLWLGNVSFTAASDDEVAVDKDAAFETVCALLDVPPETLEFALTHRMMSVRGESYEVQRFPRATIDHEPCAPAHPASTHCGSFLSLAVDSPFRHAIVWLSWSVRVGMQRSQ